MGKRLCGIFLALCLTVSVTCTEAWAAGNLNPAKTEETSDVQAETSVDLLFLVNGKNPMPEGYTPELASLENGHAVDIRAYDALVQMLADCRAAGLSPYIISSYRTQETQQRLYNNKVAEMQNWGYPLEEARVVAARAVAAPGTSEHQLGLAVDIVDSTNATLTNAQANTNVQQWLMKNCWNYGFILRYQGDKTELTGVMYEPWHYRYVGVEAAKEMGAGWLCLEEYLSQPEKEAKHDG